MQVKIFVLSDIHAFDSSKASGSRPSYFDTSMPSGGGDNPMEDLKRTIKDEGITADFLVCCGDFSDCANPVALEKSWAEVQMLKSLLKAKRIFSSVGNHDIDSRHTYNDHDAKGQLLNLAPGFPFEDPIENNHFWTHHFIISELSDKLRIVVVNSSGYHGEGTEHGHGRVSKRTLDRLVQQLKAQGRCDTNIVVCHHHPQKLSELKLNDYDDMKGGYEFLRALDAVEFGPWLVIHGHKHFPKITYASGGAAAPVVFSAGSFAAIPYPEIQQLVGNQVYLLTLGQNNGLATSCSGGFESWDWAPARGWQTAQIRSGLPARGGFGYRGELADIAIQIEKSYPAGARWRDVESSLGPVRFLIPEDLSKLIQLLETQFNYKFETSKEGVPILFERP